MSKQIVVANLLEVWKGGSLVLQVLIKSGDSFVIDPVPGCQVALKVLPELRLQPQRPGAGVDDAGGSGGGSGREPRR